MDTQLNIPDKLISDIADWLNCGHTVYLNPVTLEIETMVSSKHEWHDSFGDTHELIEEIEQKVDSWDEVITFEIPESWESFKIMEDFANSLPVKSRTKSALSHALSGRKPFAHFNAIIHQDPEREEWFAFRHSALEDRVREELECHRL